MWRFVNVCVSVWGFLLCVSGGSSVRLLSFNAGLTPVVPHYAERRAWIGPSLTSTHADIACLQEVWSSKDMESILSHVGDADHFPHSFSYLHDASGSLARVSASASPCGSSSFLRSFLPCITRYCNAPTMSTVDRVKCAYRQCKMSVQLSQECITCLVLSNPSSIVDSCRNSRGYRFNVPGLLLLSKYPLKEVTLSRYEPTEPHGKLLLPRYYIRAEVDGVGSIVCTHTTANLGPKYFEELPYGSWEAQNMAEAHTLVRSLGDAQSAVIMGDLNSSPAVPFSNVVADFEGFYDYLVESGFSPSYVERLGVCTWCEYNPLTEEKAYMVLDHVFLRNLTAKGALRVLDDNLPGLPFPLSDHYGVEVIV